jgi:hypothetical protein
MYSKNFFKITEKHLNDTKRNILKNTETEYNYNINIFEECLPTYIRLFEEERKINVTISLKDLKDQKDPFYIVNFIENYIEHIVNMQCILETIQLLTSLCNQSQISMDFAQEIMSWTDHVHQRMKIKMMLAVDSIIDSAKKGNNVLGTPEPCYTQFSKFLEDAIANKIDPNIITYETRNLLFKVNEHLICYHDNCAYILEHN